MFLFLCFLSWRMANPLVYVIVDRKRVPRTRPDKLWRGLHGRSYKLKRQTVTTQDSLNTE